jgi:Flp pilus assembly protein CpaB
VIVLVVVLVVVAAIAGAMLFSVINKKAPRETADKFLTAIKSKNVSAAHGMLCKDGQKKVSEADIKSTFHLDQNTVTSYTITGENKDTANKNVTIEHAALTYNNGDKQLVELHVVGESGGKICGF